METSGCLLCPYHWRLHGDHCYYYSDVTERTWSQSRDDCKMMGADLLVIKDKEQQEFINKISITQYGDDTCWIGLHRDGDVWRWVDGEHYSGSLFEIKTQKSGGCISKTRSDYYQDDCSTTKRCIYVKKAVRI
ncbi:killer cell lectin-like receptor subfamily F member 2 [Phyllobates terribilis]|uniref:killer cell lectin-like receptor subfamily F member 2 n=1 Tax=Phyllobates terribilis TaxID=111132 RepID=UPI003CCAFB54